MWRTIAIGVVVAGLLAGCSWGGRSSEASAPLAHSSQPSDAAVSRVVTRLAHGSVPGGMADAKCTVVSPERARCDVAELTYWKPVRLGRVWFKLRHSGDAWSLQPDCGKARSASTFCVALLDKVRERRLRARLGSGHCTSSSHGETSELTCVYVGANP
jgi:hypothetical protein